MRHLIRVTGFIITTTLLLAVVAGSAQVHQAGAGQSEVVPASTDNAEQTEDTALVCLALVGGTALLAGAVWMRELRPTQPQWRLGRETGHTGRVVTVKNS